MFRLSVLLGLTFLLCSPTTADALPKSLRCSKHCGRSGKKSKSCYKKCMKNKFVAPKSGRLVGKYRKGSTKKKMGSSAAAKKALQKLRKKNQRKKLRERNQQKKAKSVKKRKMCIKMGLKKCHPKYFKKLPKTKQWQAAQRCRQQVSQKCNR